MPFHEPPQFARRFRAGLLLVCLSGCALLDGEETPDYRTIRADPYRDPETAQAENDRAVELIREGEWNKAGEALQKALIADVSHGPAHNNLGLVHYRRGELYLAAWEFDYARSLMPERPEVPNNLGLVYETAGRLPQAIEHYALAHALAPEDPRFLGNLLRARIRDGERSPEIRRSLRDLLLYETRPEWREWAREQLHTTHLDVPAADQDPAPGVDAGPPSESLPAPPRLVPQEEPPDGSD